MPKIWRFKGLTSFYLMQMFVKPNMVLNRSAAIMRFRFSAFRAAPG